MKNIYISGRDEVKKGKKYIKKPIPVIAKQVNHDFEVVTLEGLMIGNAGDYLVQGYADELWVVKKEIFENTYEEVIE